MKNIQLACLLAFLLSLFSISLSAQIADSMAFSHQADSLLFTQIDSLHAPSDSSLLQFPDSLNLPDSLLTQFPDSLAAPLDSLTQNLSPDSLNFRPDSLRPFVIQRIPDNLDSITRRIYAYQMLPQHGYSRSLSEIDTTLHNFHNNNPVIQNFHAGAFLGNLGLPYYPIGYEKRTRTSDFHFLDPFKIYLHDPEQTIFYNSTFPYTHIDYSSAGSKALNESIFKLIHSQNINKDWSAGIRYDIFSSNGQYAKQSTADNAFSIYSAYRGDQYSAFGSFDWNNIRVRENGGLANLDNFLRDKGRPADQAIRSGEGKTEIINRSLYFHHSFALKGHSLASDTASVDTISLSRFNFAHTFRFEWSKRQFKDTATYILRQFQATPFFNLPQTFDSIHFRRLSNHFEVNFSEKALKKFTAGFAAGLYSEIDRINQDIIPDTATILTPQFTPSIPMAPPIFGQTDLVSFRKTSTFFNTAVTGRFYNHSSSYLNWDVNAKLYFTGYKIGDFDLEGLIRLKFPTAKGDYLLNLSGSFENTHPTYFYQSFASNLIAWENNFSSSQNIRASGEFLIPHIHLKLGAYLSQLNNHIYLDNQSMPSQSSKPILTGTMYAEKEFRVWYFAFLIKLYAQYSSSPEVIPLPVIAAVQSTYAEFPLFKQVLKVRIGWDAYFHTKYFAYAYNPVFNAFHTQNSTKIGNFPYLDFFLSMQIKQARLFVRTDGFYSLFESFLGKNYLQAFPYPMNQLRVKFGVSWAFYN